MDANSVPFAGATEAFFREIPEGPSIERIEEAARGVVEDDRVTCRNCLNKFDVNQQWKSTPERGYLRTNLKMLDYGREVVICDVCWPGVIGHRTLIHGRVVPGDPEVIDNPLLRAMSEGRL